MYSSYIINKGVLFYSPVTWDGMEESFSLVLGVRAEPEGLYPVAVDVREDVQGHSRGAHVVVKQLRVSHAKEDCISTKRWSFVQKRKK